MGAPALSMLMKQPSRTRHTKKTWHQTQKSPVRILAIDPGTRYMGVAFLVGNDLIRADVERVHLPGMRQEEVIEKALFLLSRWIEQYRPDIVAVEESRFAQSKRSVRLRRIVQAITAVTEKHGASVEVHAPTTVRRFVCTQGRPTRLAVARVIATEHFPWLLPYYQKELQKSWWRPKYWTHLFDAVAVGLACHGLGPARRTVPRAA